MQLFIGRVTLAAICARAGVATGLLLLTWANPLLEDLGAGKLVSYLEAGKMKTKAPVQRMFEVVDRSLFQGLFDKAKDCAARIMRYREDFEAGMDVRSAFPQNLAGCLQGPYNQPCEMLEFCHAHHYQDHPGLDQFTFDKVDD